MNYGLLIVEFVVCTWILVMLAAELLVPRTRTSTLWQIALLGVLVAAVALAWAAPSAEGQTFQQMFVADRFAVYFKMLFLLTAAVVILMTREFQRHLSVNLGAFYMLLFTALLGIDRKSTRLNS